MIQVECASGVTLPYLGYIEIEVEVPSICSSKIPAIFLLVPHLKCHDLVSGLLGTNLLILLLEGSRTSQGILHFTFYRKCLDLLPGRWQIDVWKCKIRTHTKRIEELLN